MESDLISRKDMIRAVCAYVENHRNGDEISWTGFDWLLKEDAVIEIINSQPAAYDVDKVVEKLELLSENAEYNDLNTYEEKAAYNTAYSKAAEVVKGGGVDEQGAAGSF